MKKTLIEYFEEFLGKEDKYTSVRAATQMFLASELKEARIAAKVSITELSRLLGVSRPFVSNIEAGRVGIPPKLLPKLKKIKWLNQTEI